MALVGSFLLISLLCGEHYLRKFLYVSTVATVMFKISGHGTYVFHGDMFLALVLSSGI